MSMRVPNMPPVSAGRAQGLRDNLPNWPSVQEVAEAITTYYRALADLDAAYDALTPTQKAAVRSPQGHLG